MSCLNYHLTVDRNLLHIDFFVLPITSEASAMIKQRRGPQLPGIVLFVSLSTSWHPFISRQSWHGAR